jgi:hypothetical protein
MCDGLLEVSDVALTDALREVITLNGELRKLRAETESAGTRRRQEYEAHVSTLNTINRDLGREVEMLRAKVIALTPYIPPRRVAEEMGLREGMATASGLVAEREPDQK